MGFTVSRETAKNLIVRRKNKKKLTVSRKKVNHKFFSWPRSVTLKVSRSLSLLRLLCSSMCLVSRSVRLQRLKTVP